MKKFKIMLFTVKFNWEYIQVEWIVDEYTLISASYVKWTILDKSELKLIHFWQQEAKDLIWVYWRIEVKLETKEIEL